ncbi:hypothetical protein GCM10009830_11530 [Glycomyces endophyticus]|uniref:Uncharacterized protein n=1 Tax=Glycomyces endophyticus TaxID=480996 RepID=A0ABN2G9C2_9ACTN
MGGAGRPPPPATIRHRRPAPPPDPATRTLARRLRRHRPPPPPRNRPPHLVTVAAGFRGRNDPMHSLVFRWDYCYGEFMKPANAFAQRREVDQMRVASALCR